MKIFEFDTIESTQDIALQKDFECIVIANNQTKGRGRLDRKWQSLEGNLFCSIVIKAEIQDIFTLVMSISTALIEAIGAGQIKWPNDVLINGKKACGVLIEKGQEGYYVIGVGINVVKAPSIEGLIYPATSLKDEGIIKDKTQILNTMIKSLFKNFNDKDLFAKYKKDLYGINKPCKINNTQGVLLDIDKSGYLLIKQSDGSIKKEFAGDLFF